MRVLIDGACPYCRALGRTLKALDLGGTLQVVPLQEASGLDPKALLEELHVLEGDRTHRGYAALLALARRLPLLWPLYPLLLLLAPFIGGVRTLTPFLFGAWGFPFSRFLPLVALGSLLWTQGLFLLGYFLGQHLPLWAILLGLLLLGGIGLLLSRRPYSAG